MVLFLPVVSETVLRIVDVYGQDPQSGGSRAVAV